MDTTSRWLRSNPIPQFPRLESAMQVDVVVIGGGITGLTAAYLLKQGGAKVALLERHRLGQGETGHTTAHLTYVTDTRLTQLVSKFGRDHARAVWDANGDGLALIRDIVAREHIDCDLQTVPGFLHLPREEKPSSSAIHELRQEAELAASLGFAAEFVDCAPLVGRPAICFDSQSEFHVLKYLAGLATLLTGPNVHVFEESEVVEFEDKPTRVKANGQWISCDYLIIATHVPLQGETSTLRGALFQSKLFAYSTYAVGAKLPPGSTPAACFWDTKSPYDYLRIDRQPIFDYAILGGRDHKTGQVTDTEKAFIQLELSLHALLPQAQVDARWSGQVIETNDGLPFIGEIVPKQFIATGFAGNGMTFGSLAAMMAADVVLGRKNPWVELLDPHRKKVLGGSWDYVTENADYPYYLLKDRMAAAEGKSLDDLHVGEGKLLKIKGAKLACYRDEHGEVHAVSPTCTHMGCLVHWNAAEKTWDCPCHGSRFTPTGEVVAGPAESPLKPMAVPADSSPA